MHVTKQWLKLIYDIEMNYCNVFVFILCFLHLVLPPVSSISPYQLVDVSSDIQFSIVNEYSGPEVQQITQSKNILEITKTKKSKSNN